MAPPVFSGMEPQKSRKNPAHRLWTNSFLGRTMRSLVRSTQKKGFSSGSSLEDLQGTDDFFHGQMRGGLGFRRRSCKLRGSEYIN